MKITKTQLKQIIKEELNSMLQEELPFGIGNLPSHFARGASRVFGGQEAAYDAWKKQKEAAGEEVPYDYEQFSQAEDVFIDDNPPTTPGGAVLDAYGGPFGGLTDHDRRQTAKKAKIPGHPVQARLADIATEK